MLHCGMARRGRGEIGKAGSADCATMPTNSSVSPHKQAVEQYTQRSLASSQLDVQDHDSGSSNAVGPSLSREPCEDVRGGSAAGDAMQAKEFLSEREGDLGLLSRLDGGSGGENGGGEGVHDDEAGVAAFEAALVGCFPVCSSSRVLLSLWSVE